MLDIRIRWNGVRVRLKGFGPRKYFNLRILEAGLASVKARVKRGLNENDGKAAPLTKRYARFKSKRTGGRAIRDLTLTGDLLEGIKARYSDDYQAKADATGRLGRIKAAVHRNQLKFSPQDQAVMSEVARGLFKEDVSAVTEQLTPRGARGGRGSRTAFRRDSSVFTRTKI